MTKNQGLAYTLGIWCFIVTAACCILGIYSPDPFTLFLKCYYSNYSDCFRLNFTSNHEKGRRQQSINELIRNERCNYPIVYFYT